MAAKPRPAHPGRRPLHLPLLPRHARGRVQHADRLLRRRRHHPQAAARADWRGDPRPRARRPDAEEGHAHDGRRDHHRRTAGLRPAGLPPGQHLHPAADRHHRLVRRHRLRRRLYQGIQAQYALRNSSYTPSSSNFLKNYDGTSLTPESGALYVVLSTGNYYKSIYRYNGSSYEQVFDYLPQLLSQEIQDIPVNNFTPVHGVLYRTYNQGIPEYRYYKDNLTQYLQYNPTINITISSEDTMELIPGTYYYEISVVYKNESGEILHKITLLEPTEFIIGGSNINE